MAVGRGRLRIYLGAAPGVGKTYAMLREGHRRVERGTDVVVGFVDSRDRPRTAEQVDISLDTDVLFRLDSAELTPGAGLPLISAEG